MNKILKVKRKDLINSYYTYAAGYYESGIDLIDILLNEKRYCELPNSFRIEAIKLEEENRIYPIMFLFRQYIELMIKALYLQFEIKTDKDTCEKVFKDHSFKNIWPDLKKKLEEEENEDSELTGLVDIISETVDFFICFDNESYNCRYPTNKVFQFYLKENQKYDLDNIKSMVKNFDEYIHYFI